MPGVCDRDTVLVEFRFKSVLCNADAAAVTRMVRQCWRANLRSGVTGEMLIDGREVSQVIEGEMDVILPMVARILSDPRHTEIETVTLGALDARRYCGWRVHGLPDVPACAADVATGAIAHFPVDDVVATRMAGRRMA